MKTRAWRPSSRSTRTRFLTLLVVFAAIYGVYQLHTLRGANAATALCEGQPGTHTLVAPSAVTPGQSFKLTSITGSANTNVATVDSVKLTFSVQGATPSTITESWNDGPVHGDYTATYPDVTLTATGAAGSKVTVDLSSIEAAIEIGTLHTTITCSVANGQLTANNAGESLNLAAINIVAPAAPSPATPQSSPSKKSRGTTIQPTPTPTPASPTAAPAPASGQDVTITVRDHHGKVIEGAKVALDSLPIVKTNAQGQVTLTPVGSGDHNLSVIASGKTVTQVISVADPPADGVLQVAIKLPSPTYKLQKLTAGGLSGAILLIVGLRWWRRQLAAKRYIDHHFPFGTT